VSDADAHDVTSRLRAAVQAEAAAVEPDGDAALDAIRTRGRVARRRRRALAAAGGVAAVLALAVAIPTLEGARGRTVTTGPAASPTVDTAPVTEPDDTTTTTTEPAPTSTTAEDEAVPEAPDPTTSTTETSPTTSTTEPRTDQFPNPPLYPFRNFAEVEEWQAAYAEGGHQPWHLSAETTALSFTGYLGFTDVDQVVSSDIGATDAHVTVGYALPEGGLAPAAEIHLVRFGSGDDAPWEVVGTRDDRLTLDTPDYDSTVASPFTVGGFVTGVDESLRVQVRQLSSQGPIGETCCIPAGGERTAWETSVSFSGAVDPVLTVVVSTGGHVQDVEAFAITAVRP
jgi:hypothetical protein